MTKYLSHPLIVVLLVFLKMPLRADSIPEIVAKAKPAIVEIVVTDATGAPKDIIAKLSKSIMGGDKVPLQKFGAQYGIGNQEPAETDGGHLQAASPEKIPGPAWASGRIHFGV
jgi:hypothetical protein